MRLQKEEVRLHDFKKRCHKKSDKDSDWKGFMKKGESYSEVLGIKQPDIIERLNQEIRDEKEKNED